MRNPFRQKLPADADAHYDVVSEALSLILSDKDSIPRQLLAILIRSEAKNFFALQVGNNVEMFERELEQRSARALASLGSAGSPAGQLEREVRRALTILERDHRKVLYTLPRDKVCWNSACATQEPVPHMLDERNHRTIGEVEEEKPGWCGDKSPFSPLPCGRPAGHTGHHKRGEREWDSRTLSTCTPDKPCNLPGHGGTLDPTIATNVLNLCPHATFTIPNKENS